MMELSNTVYCGKCELSLHEHEYEYLKYPGRKNIIFFCKCPNCRETIHKDNEMVKCCDEKFCWVCINDEHVKHAHPERYM